MNAFWVLLLVQATSTDEAIQAVMKYVEPDVRESLARPFLQAKGVYPIDVYVHSLDKVHFWANCFKEDSKPALLAFFERP